MFDRKNLKNIKNGNRLSSDEMRDIKKKEARINESAEQRNIFISALFVLVCLIFIGTSTYAFQCFYIKRQIRSSAMSTSFFTLSTRYIQAALRLHPRHLHLWDGINLLRIAFIILSKEIGRAGHEMLSSSSSFTWTENERRKWKRWHLSSATIERKCSRSCRVEREHA